MAPSESPWWIKLLKSPAGAAIAATFATSFLFVAFTHPQVIATALGRGPEAQSISSDQATMILTELKKTRKASLETKIVAQAIVDVLPMDERNRAKNLIADRMNVLRLADSQGQQ